MLGSKNIGATVPRPLKLRGMFDRKTCLFPKWVSLPNLVALGQRVWV